MKDTSDDERTAPLGWWFAPPGELPPSSLTAREDLTPIVGERGLHAALRLVDALPHARSPWLCRVRLDGGVARGVLTARPADESARSVRTGAGWAVSRVDVQMRSGLLAGTARTVLFALDVRPSLLALVRRTLDRWRALDGSDAPVLDAALAALSAGAAPPAPPEEARDGARASEATERAALDSLEWRVERARGAADDALLSALAQARARFAGAHARALVLEALAALRPHEVGALAHALDLLIYAEAWALIATAEASSASLDAALDAVRARANELLEQDAIARARRDPLPSADDATSAPASRPIERDATTSPLLSRLASSLRTTLSRAPTSVPEAEPTPPPAVEPAPAPSVALDVVPHLRAALDPELAPIVVAASFPAEAVAGQRREQLAEVVVLARRGDEQRVLDDAVRALRRAHPELVPAIVVVGGMVSRRELDGDRAAAHGVELPLERAARARLTSAIDAALHRATPEVRELGYLDPRWFAPWITPLRDEKE